ncbi:MAG: SSS family solute:Na+ symporter [Candidatus Latescibacterota bacterium]|jgi:SSS family solute:Na+ symporter
MGPTGIEYVVVGCYLAALVGVGMVFRKFNENVSDYFRNGCKGTWWLVGSSAFMTAFSAWTFSGAAGAAYEAGWSVLVIYLANSVGFAINGLFLAKWFRQIRAMTGPEVIRLRFSVATQQFYAWMSFFMQTLYSSLHLLGLAIFCSAVFGYQIEQVIVVVGLVVLVYSLIGGSWAVTATDFLQTLILIPITILVSFLCLVKLGGVGALLDGIQNMNLSSDYAVFNEPERFPLRAYTYAWALAMLIKNVIGYNTLTSAQRYFSVKDGREAQKAAWLGFILMTAGAFIWFIPPMTARLLYDAQVMGTAIPKPAEAAYAIASLNVLPVGMTGLMVVAMFAATMSSMDSGLNRNAAIFTNDIYPTLCGLFGKVPVEGKHLMRLGQMFSAGFGLCIVSIATYFANTEGKGVFEHMLNVGALLALPMAVPTLMGMFIRSTPSWAAIVTVCVTLVPSALGFFSEALFGETWSFQQKVFTNIAVGVVVYLLTMPFWKYASEDYQKQTDGFFERMLTPVDFAKEVGKPNDLRQLKIIGSFAAVMGGLICLLVFVPNPLIGRLGILFVGGFVLCIGCIFVWLGRRSEADEIQTQAAD